MILETDFIIRQDGAEFRAPDIETLRRWSAEGRVRADSQVFHPALKRWSRARDLPELAASFQAETNLVDLAKSYRQLVLGVGAQILIVAASRSMPDLAPIFGFALIAVIALVMYYAYRTAKALGSAYAAVWALAMLVPCINILTLLVLSSKATAVCRARGIEVGFLGPKI